MVNEATASSAVGRVYSLFCRRTFPWTGALKLQCNKYFLGIGGLATDMDLLVPIINVEFVVY